MKSQHTIAFSQELQLQMLVAVSVLNQSQNSASVIRGIFDLIIDATSILKRFTLSPIIDLNLEIVTALVGITKQFSKQYYFDILSHYYMATLLNLLVLN